MNTSLSSGGKRQVPDLWGRSHTNLQAVLAERTDEEEALARKHIQAGEASLHLPLVANVEFDQ